MEAGSGSRAGTGMPIVAANPAPEAADQCLTQTVRITLASEQVSFCAPTSLPINVVEDGTSDSEVSYAGLNQFGDYGFMSIKATSPGNSPGPGWPVYNAGQVSAYRRAVRDLETARTDRTVSAGPSAQLLGETVAGMQEDITLSTSVGDQQLRTVEWYLEHNNRLWSFILTWDTGMQNAREWKAASENFSAQKAVGKYSTDTAIDLGIAFTKSNSTPDTFRSAGPVDVGTPPWWSGPCDFNHYYPATGVTSTLLWTWHGISACGPVPTTDYGVYFFPGSYGSFEFECVELVLRFLYLEWGIAPWRGNGNTLKDYYDPAKVAFYPNDGTHAIIPGDVITENGDGSKPNSVGHTAIVTGVSLNGSGNGTINILEQNSHPSGHRSLSVHNWIVDPDPYTWGKTIQGWLHAKANQPDGDLDQAFIPGTGPNGRVYAIALQPGDGKILIAGDFTSYNGTSINRVARLNTDGSLDTSFNPGVGVAISDGSSDPHVYTLAIQSNGQVLIGGHFDSYNGSPRNYIARLNSNGQLDGGFVPVTEVHADVFKIAVQTDGNILVGGDNILRLNNLGAVDTTFTGSTNNSVHDLAIQPADGKILIGGNFSTVKGTGRAGIARLNSDGTLDTTFNPGSGIGTSGVVVAAIALQADGKILIGGNFNSYNGTLRNKIARLNSNGSLDGTFNPGTGLSGSTDFVHALVSQPDGRILIGGYLSSYNGTALSHLGRLNYNGSLETSFYARTDEEVDAIVLQPDAKIIIGGDFTGYIARLLNHFEPCYTLTTLASPIAGGSVTVNTAPNCPGGKYINGSLVQIMAVPNSAADYWLLNWSGDATGSSNPLSVTLNSDKSVTANFMQSPGAFNKSLPVNGTTNLPANPTLSWETSSGADSYEYCLYTTDSTDCDPDSDNWVSTGASTSITLGNLFPSISYHWQVRARNAVDTTNATGASWSFTRNGVPAVPVPVSPGGTIFVTHPTYIWSKSNGAMSYLLTVYSFGASTTAIYAVNSSACSGGVCTYQPSVELPLGDYKFRISAITGANASEYSDWSDFKVRFGLFFPVIGTTGR